MKKIIKQGDLAPPFQTNDLWGNPINVPSREKWIYLSFHRFATCPFCNLRTNELIKEYENFKKHNIEIVSIWPSSKDKLLHYAGKDKTPFPMISDKNKKIYTAYGVINSSLLGALGIFLHPKLMLKALKQKNTKLKIDADPKLLPASFLVDPNGIIKMAYYGAHIGDHPNIDTVLQITETES